MKDQTSINRREFLRHSATLSAALTIGVYIPDATAQVAKKLLNKTAAEFVPNAFIRITPDNKITVLIKHLEMGQGVYTGLTQLIAEELDVEMQKITVTSAPANVTLYKNLFFGIQGTGGSTAVANSWKQLREAGAMAREMLISAAAQTWGVDRTQLKTLNGFVILPDSDKKLSYGELALKAQTLTPPTNVKLKERKDFKVIGTSPLRKDGFEKINGTATFGIDVKQKNQLVAVIQRPPVFGAKVKNVNSTAARKIKGVKEVIKIPAGVAVIADNFWAAKLGRDALSITWDTPKASQVTSSEMTKQYVELASQPGTIAKDTGQVTAKMAEAAQKMEATYEFPYLAHAPMEPLNCVIHFEKGKCQIWTGCQFQTIDQANVAKILGVQPKDVNIHTLIAGGSFGRRANPQSDYISEAAWIAKTSRFSSRPIQLMWTREDDIKGGYYRPAFVHKAQIGLDKKGLPLAWHHRIVGQSIMAGSSFEAMMKNGVDPSSVEGIDNLPYTVPNLKVELHSPKNPVPVLWWRSVGHTHTAYVVETLVDELAHMAGKDAVAYRLELLKEHPRLKGVLELAAKKAGWGKSLPKGRALGVALAESFNSYVAQVAEVSVVDGKVKVHKVTCAVDCGVAINPDNIKAQMEGGIGFGLSAILYSEISLDKGVVNQSNFHDYQALRINEMPQVEVHIVESNEAPTGVGEPGVPPIGPAVANALFKVTGKRIRKLPIKLDA